MKTILRLLALVCLVVTLAAAAPLTPAYRDPSLPVEVRVEDLLSRMTLQEKLNQIRSDDHEDVWKTAAGTTGFGEVFDITRPLSPREAARLANEVQRLARQSRLRIPIIIRDEALHGLVASGATSFPQSIGLAATWDPALVGRVGDAIGHEARVRGVRRVLSPVINVTRDARWGRVEETYGEDPLLTSRIAVPYVRGIEGRGVATCPKHFVANVGDGGRDSHAISLSEQTLREVYLPPFEAVVKEAGAHSIMTAYNSVNGRACSANHWLLTDLLKREWGFTGVVGSDYGAASGTQGAHRNTGTDMDTAAADFGAGLDIEWPTVGISGKPLEEALRQGLVSPARLDDAVRRMLRTKFELGLFDDPMEDPGEAERVVQCDEHRALALEAAREAIVLLRNRNQTLPLSKTLRSVAVIGAAARDGMPLGGYSGWNVPTVSVFDGLQAKLGPDVDLQWARGGQAHAASASPPIPSWHFQNLRGEYFDNPNLSGTPVMVRDDSQINFVWTNRKPSPGMPGTNFSVRWTGQIVPAETGICTFTLRSDDGVRLYLDDELVIDNWTIHAPMTDRAEVKCVQGRAMDLRLEYYQAAGLAEVALGWSIADEFDPGVQEAATLAERCDAAIVVATIEEGEGRDRSSLDLPGNQVDAIRAVAATGTPTIVVLLAGAPVTMREWGSDVDAVIDAWYPGQEGGTAIADVLFGDTNPGGKLPITFPRSVGQCPLYYNMAPSGRGYDYVDSSGSPLYPFGYGLSYTSFEYSALRVSPEKAHNGQTVTVSFEVQNTGAVKGDEVPQLYVHDLVASMVRPLKELKDFTRLTLEPGEKKTVSFRLTPKQLAFWNERMQHVVEPGEFDVMVGSSSSDIRLRGTLVVQ